MVKRKSEKLPQNVALDVDQQAEFDKKVKQVKEKTKEETDNSGPGVIYIGHIPHGFFEPQMKGYFSQFGVVNRLRIARSKKTGNIKGYGFVEFEHDEVAKIVAETMNNYLMFNKLLKCQHLQMSQVHPDTFKDAGRFQKPKGQLLSVRRHNSERTERAHKKNVDQMKKNVKKNLSKLAALGIEYEFKMGDEVLKAVPLETVGDAETKAKDDDNNSEGADDDDDDDDVQDKDEFVAKGDQTLALEAMHVLYEDSSEEEISFRTPPQSVKSTRLTPKPASTKKRPASAVKEKTTKAALGKRKAKSAGKGAKKAKK